MGPREFYEVIASTQDRALALARAGAVPGSSVVARSQTAGRGRNGHRWWSAPGALHLSIVLPAPAGPATLIPLALGASIGEALRAEYGAPIVVKWPNDLVVIGTGGRPRKLGGILVDRVAGSAGPAAVAGIGVNVAVDERALPPQLTGSVASLHEYAARAPELGAVEALVASTALATATELAGPDGARAWIPRCRAALWGVGRRAFVDGVDRGTIAGLEDDGALLVRDGPTLVPISAGDLRVGEPA